MRDELVNGHDVAVYWLEYVLRFNGTNHLKLTSRNIPFYQLYHLDVILFLSAIICFLISIVVIIVRNIMRCLFMANKSVIPANTPLKSILKKTR